VEYKIEMPYIGGILSENAYKWKTRGTKPFVKIWMRELANKVRDLDIPIVDRYEVGVYGKFTDERRPDISNLFKVIGDALEEGMGINDKHFRLMDKGYSLGHIDPELVITIVPGGTGGN
jgi:Holliday junction resolvase RusA-like endonuclease